MAMKYVAAYAMANLGGKATPTEADVTKILDAAGVAIDKDTLKVVLKKLEGKDVNEVIASGLDKLESLGGGGGGAAAPAAGGAAAAGGGAPAAVEEKKEEVEEEDMDFDLFG